MSSVLHPVGPEPGERYWVRRLAVVVAAIVAIGIVVALVGNALSAGSAVQAEPALPTYVPVPVTASPTPSATPSTSPTPSAKPSTTPSTKPSTTASAEPSTTPSATPTRSPSPTTSPSPSPTASGTTPARTKASSEKTSSDKNQQKSGAAKTGKDATPAACAASSLRPTVVGERSVKATKQTTFSLSLVNGSRSTCTVKVAPASVALTVVSGSDRIWSTRSCPAAQPTLQRTIKPEHAAEWKVTWSGKRAGDGCSTSTVAPKPGYYWAIAETDGADEVRFRIILT